MGADERVRRAVMDSLDGDIENVTPATGRALMALATEADDQDSRISVGQKLLMVTAGGLVSALATALLAVVTR